MRSTRLASVLVLLAVLTAFTAHARKAKVPPPSRLTLVQAQCDAVPPGPCSTFRFTKGVATLRGARQPAPTCPRTGDDPSENDTGDVRLDGVTNGGTSYTGTLAAEVVQKTTFGTDPNGTCSLAEVQLEVLSLSGTLACEAGKCRGDLVALACLPKGCADTPIVSEVTSLVVKDDLGNALAAPGTVLIPAASDAP